MNKRCQVETCKLRLPGLCAAIIIVLVSAIAYYSIRNIYFSASDFKYLIYGKNVDFSTLLRHFIPHAGDTGYLYIPLLIWKLDYLLWGFEPQGYLIQALLVHCANAFLIYCICRVAGGRWLLALLAGLLFALFPLNTEVVCWASGSFYSFSTLFYLGALLAYAAWRAGKASRSAYILSLVLEAIALFTYGATVTLPVMVWLLDAFLLCGSGECGSFLSRSTQRLKRCAPYFLIVLVYLAFLYGFDLGMSYPETGITYRLPTVLEQLLVNIPILFVLPLKPTTMLAGGVNLWLLSIGAKLPALACAVALGLILAHFNRPLPRRYIATGLLWIAVCVLPFWKSFWYLEWDLQSSRHLYLASGGWALFLAALIAGGSRRRRAFSVWLGACVVLCYLLLTVSYVRDWERASNILRTVTTKLKKEVSPTSGMRIYIMNLPWMYNGVPVLWNPIAIMQWISPDEAIPVQRKWGMSYPGGDSILWERCPFKIFILNRSLRLTYFRNEYDKPPKLGPDKLGKLRYGLRDLFFIWDGNRQELRNVTPEIEKMVRDGKLEPPFDIYIKSTIWSSPPDSNKMPREEWLAI